MSESRVVNVETRKIRKMRTLLIATRVFAAIVIVISFSLTISSIDPVIWNFHSFWYGLKFFIFLIEMLFLLIGYGIAYILGYGDAGAVAIMSAIHVALFGGNNTILGIPFEDLVTNPLQLPQQQNLIDAIYAFFIMITIIIAVISGIGFLRNCNPALSAISFFSLNIVLGLASLNDKLLLNLDFDSTNFFAMVFSRLVMTAFMIYLSLELSFQTSYIYNVIGPNLERGRRISTNINRLRNFEMPQQPKKEISKDESFFVKGKNTATGRFKATIVFSEFRALLSKKLFKISDTYDMNLMNARLKTFYLKLEENDPFLAVSLSTSAYLPSIMRLIIIIFASTIFRMTILFILTYLALNPIPLLTILNLPPSIINSVEAGEYEIVFFILIPLSILFLIVGLLIQWIQKRFAIRMYKVAQRGPAIHSVKEENVAKPKKATET